MNFVQIPPDVRKYEKKRIYRKIKTLDSQVYNSGSNRRWPNISMLFFQKSDLLKKDIKRGKFHVCQPDKAIQNDIRRFCNANEIHLEKMKNIMKTVCIEDL